MSGLSTSFTWDFGELSGQRSCRVDLTLDFSLRNSEHTMMWELAQDKIIAEYVRCFSQRCVTLEAEQQEDRSVPARRRDACPRRVSTFIAPQYVGADGCKCIREVADRS